MRVRSLLLPVLSCLLGLGVLVTPAQAAAPPIALSPVDVSRPGHVSGTLETDAPWVKVLLRHEGYDVPNAVVLPVDATTRSAAYDLEAWGLDTAIVVAIPCTGPADADCTGPRTTNAEFAVTGIAPTITWSGGEVTPRAPLTATVDDPEGGGQLILRSAACEVLLPIDRTGTTEVDTEYCRDGAVTFAVDRCWATHVGWCTSTGITHTAQVHQRQSFTWDREPEDVSPDDTTAPDLTLRIEAVPGATYDVTWRVAKLRSGNDAGAEGALQVTADADGLVQVPLDLTPVADGRVHVLGRLVDVDNGLTANIPWDTDGFLVDATAPTATAHANWPTFYPDTSDGYRNFVTAGLSDVAGGVHRRYLDVRDATGAVVLTQEQSLRWDGRIDRALAPEGAYELVVRLVDEIGNERVLEPVRVTLSHKTLERRTWTRTVTARDSLLDTWTGRCSQVDRSVADRAAGTLGLRSNATCRRTSWAGDGVVTVHSIRLPKAAVYDGAQVSARSGAAVGHPGSRAFLDYWRADQGRWRYDNLIGSRWGQHGADVVDRVAEMAPGRELLWRVGTADGAAYDISSFTVTARYRALV